MDVESKCTTLPTFQSKKWFCAEHSHWARRQSYYPSDAPFSAAAATHHIVVGDDTSFEPEVLQVKSPSS